MNTDKRHTLPIGEIREESPDARTFVFRHRLNARPGQFIMLTDFAGDEKPFSLSDCRENEFSITVKKVGEFTGRLFSFSPGDLVSIRGAYGSSFFIAPGRSILVGGGFGIPPLYFLARSLKDAGGSVTVINGAKTGEDLLLSERFRELGVEYLEAANDGSRGFRGNAAELCREVLAKKQPEETPDFLYAAGPELMMAALIPLANSHGLDYQFLLERYMKCAIGICGSCVMDPLGIRICREGPVLGKAQLAHLSADAGEFGRYRRGPSGHKEYWPH